MSIADVLLLDLFVSIKRRHVGNIGVCVYNTMAQKPWLLWLSIFGFAALSAACKLLSPQQVLPVCANCGILDRNATLS